MNSRGRRLILVAVVIVAVGAAAMVAVRRDAGDRSGKDAEEVATDACGPLLTKPSGATWQCSFVDEFDGTALDPDKWITQDTAETGFRSDLTCYQGPTNVAVGDGALVLEARDVGVEIDCDNPYGAFRTRYTGGLVGTRTHFSQTYGRFEVRAKFPTARTAGVHGGFWMHPVDLAYGRWPASGEIDVAEWWSSDPTLVLPTLHYKGRSFHADSGWHCRVDDVSEFHTYTLEWYPAVMQVLIDGEPCYQRSWLPSPPLVAPQPFDRPFSMILNMGVSTADDLDAAGLATSLPASFVVDYAKAWR